MMWIPNELQHIKLYLGNRKYIIILEWIHLFLEDLDIVGLLMEVDLDLAV